MWTTCAGGPKRRCRMGRGARLHLHQGSADHQTTLGVTAPQERLPGEPQQTGRIQGGGWTRAPAAVCCPGGSSSRDAGSRPLDAGGGFPGHSEPGKVPPVL